MSQATLRRLLSLLCFAALPACGSRAPLLIIDVSGIPPDTLRLDVRVMQDTRSGTASFSRDRTTNDFKYPAVMEMPPMVDAKSQAQLAIDLPLGLTGMVQVRCQSEKIPPPQSGNMMTMPTLATEACTTVALSTDMPVELSLSLQTIPSASCAGQ